MKSFQQALYTFFCVLPSPSLPTQTLLGPNNALFNSNIVAEHLKKYMRASEKKIEEALEGGKEKYRGKKIQLFLRAEQKKKNPTFCAILSDLVRYPSTCSCIFNR